jgi:hypothetical protein
MKASLGFVLALILTALISGCITYDRGTLPGVESATLSIQTVRYGAIPLPAHTAGTDPHVHDSRTPIQVSSNGKIEHTLYIERGDLHTENADDQVFRLDVQKNTGGEFSHTRRTATRITVHFGAIVGDFVEIKSGLHEGDQVIVSDMSRYSNQEKIYLE